ncbi:hypothetical protein RRF57_009867 [Xylaria bambusicola]|uniref:Uncharacterized protein n=1 Tax=Xylaria bambusicola TaxID=326684 RepID=A0AAN7URB1_9PEZI
MSLNGFLRSLRNDRSDLGFLFQGVADLITFQDLLRCLNEGFVNLLIDINPLQRTATLTRVEDRTVNNLRSRPIEVDISPHISWIFAAKLQSDIDYSVRRSPLYRQAAGDRACEADQRNLGVSNQ